MRLHRCCCCCCFYIMEPDMHAKTLLSEALKIWQRTLGEVRCRATEVEELAKWPGKICHPSHPPLPVLKEGGWWGARRGSPMLSQPCSCNRKLGPWLTWHDEENNWSTQPWDVANSVSELQFTWSEAEFLELVMKLNIKDHLWLFCYRWKNLNNQENCGIMKLKKLVFI